MRTREGQELAFQCLRLAGGNVEWAGKMLDFVTGRVLGAEGASDLQTGRPAPIDTVLIRRIARQEIDADAIWESGCLPSQNPIIRRMSSEDARERAIQSGFREWTDRSELNPPAS